MFDQIFLDFISANTAVPSSLLFFRIIYSIFICLIFLYLSKLVHKKDIPLDMFKAGMAVTVIVCFLTSIVGDSLAKSFGLLGALSIIRFRTPVKDISDLVLFLVCIGIGIGTGTGYGLMTVVSVLLILSFHYIVSLYFSERSILSYYCKVEYPRELNSYDDDFTKYLTSVNIKFKLLNTSLFANSSISNFEILFTKESEMQSLKDHFMSQSKLSIELISKNDFHI